MIWSGDATKLDFRRFALALAYWLDAMAERVIERQHQRVTEGDLLATLLSLPQGYPGPSRHLPAGDLEFLHLDESARDELRTAAALVATHLRPGVQLSSCLRAFNDLAEKGASAIDPFDRDAWQDPLAGLIDELPDGAQPSDLLAALFGAVGRLPDSDLITAFFDADAITAILRAERDHGKGMDPLFVDQVLSAHALSPRARHLLDQALENAAQAGRQRCDAIDLLATMVRTHDTYTQLFLGRRGLTPTQQPVAGLLADILEVTRPDALPLPPAPDAMTPALVRLLDEAWRLARATTGGAAGERELLHRLLALDDPQVRLLCDVLDLGAPFTSDLLWTVAEPETIAPLLPTDLGPVRDATLAAAEPVQRDEVIADIVRVFHRTKNRVVLLHGEPGVGSSSIADVLAAALRQGRFPALRHCHVITFDLGGFDTADDRKATSESHSYDTAVERVLSYLDDEPERIYVVEGFAPYLARHFARCSRRLARASYRLLIVTHEEEFTPLLACSPPLTDFLDLMELREPTPAQTQAITEQAARRVERENNLTITPKAIAAAQRMAGDYLMASRLPAKAVDLLERAAVDEAADAAMTKRAPSPISREAVASEVARLTGLPVETILGTGQDKDYVDLLADSLVGQQAAVAKVAARLDLIQKSMVDKDAPAAVFIFAGLSGTGKTELAKQIARIYSARHAMIKFAMGTYVDQWTVTSFLGSSPGYQGSDEGGRLINALNHDPYSVVLLDEAEKAHPNVWDPFLNLFDEGWITDRRGVTASGSKAFFVLTTNIGQYEIAELLRRGTAHDVIQDVVKGLMTTYHHKVFNIPCFRPEFISKVIRSGGVVAFDSLSYDALLGIARQKAALIAQRFADHHDARLVCDDDVLELIARKVYEDNQAVIDARRDDYFGARPLLPLLDLYVNDKLSASLRQLAGAPLVRVVRSGRDTAVVPVFDDGEAAALLARQRTELVTRVEHGLSALVARDAGALAGLSDDRLRRLDRLFSEVGAIL